MFGNWHFKNYSDSQKKNHLAKKKIQRKNSGFVNSGFVKTCDELVTEKKYHENQAVQKKFSVKQ